MNVVDFADAKQCENGSFTLGFYIIKLKTKYCGDIFYGRTKYDYTDGSIFCFAPGQLVQVNLKEDEDPTSVCLLFHPDLLSGTELGKKIRTRYPYFSYDINEEYWEDFAEMLGLEYARINKNTTISGFKQDLRNNEVYYMLNKALK